MRWTPPASESQWRELLSERLDGELDPESAQALDEYLTAHPDRAGQLDDLRRTSNLIREWEVEVPRPDVAFFGRLETEAQKSRQMETVPLPVPVRRTTFPFPQVLRYAAMFILGALLGSVSMKQLERPLPSRPETASNPSSEQSAQPGTASPLSEPAIGAAISARQARQLFQDSEEALQKKNEYAMLTATGLNPEEIRERLQKSSYAGSEYLLRRFRQQLDESHNRRTEL